MLRSWGCEQAQGYLLSPPVSAAAVDSLLSERSASARGAAQGA